MYRFIRGCVCQPQDLREERVWRGVARRMGQWHAVLPVVTEDVAAITTEDGEDDHFYRTASKPLPPLAEINAITPDKPTPNIWTVMHKWIYALPTGTEAEKKRQAVLHEELIRTVAELGDIPGLGKDGVSFLLPISLPSPRFGADAICSSSFPTATSSPATSSSSLPHLPPQKYLNLLFTPSPSSTTNTPHPLPPPSI